MVSIYVSIVGALASELILSGKLKGLQASQGKSNKKRHSLVFVKMKYDRDVLIT